VDLINTDRYTVTNETGGTKRMKRKKRTKTVADVRSTISLDFLADRMIKELANDVGGTVSSVLRQIIRETYTRKQNEMSTQ
jgi:hypothetical protein